MTLDDIKNQNSNITPGVYTSNWQKYYYLPGDAYYHHKTFIIEHKIFLETGEPKIFFEAIDMTDQVAEIRFLDFMCDDVLSKKQSNDPLKPTAVWEDISIEMVGDEPQITKRTVVAVNCQTDEDNGHSGNDDATEVTGGGDCDGNRLH